MSLDPGDPRWRDYHIWEGYIDASSLLLERIIQGGPNTRGLIYPALFNLRHALEVALKWHIRYAGAVVPANAGHDLNMLVAAFRQTAEGLDEDATYICDYMLGLIEEVAAIDPRAIAFRYATERNGSSVALPQEGWDLRRLRFSVDHLTVWFDHLSGYIDMSSPVYQAMLHDAGG